jgi:hypothetical protein
LEEAAVRHKWAHWDVERLAVEDQREHPGGK